MQVREAFHQQVNRLGRLAIGRVLGSVMEKSEMFCGDPSQTIREEPAGYFIKTDD